MDLLKTLKSKNQTEQKQMEQQLTAVKQLLSHDEIREREILNSMGVDNCLVQYEDKQAGYIKQQDLSKKYGTDVFHINQIKSFCVDYNLRFLPSNKFTGWIDTELGPKVRNFMKEKKVADYDLDKKFFVMAPPKQFELQEIEDVSPRYDPFLFYQIDDEHYYLLHQWGKDLSSFRYVTGFAKRSFASSQIHYFFITLALSMAFLGLFAVTSILSAFLISIFGASALVGIRYSYLRNDNERDLDEKYNRRLWNQDIIYKES